MIAPRVVILTGAGTSVGAGMPAASGLRDMVIDRLSGDSTNEVGRRVAEILKKATNLFASRAAENPLEPNPDLEFLVDRLLSIASLPHDALSEDWRNIPTYDMSTLTSFVIKHVVEVLYEEVDSSYLANVGELLSHQNPLWVFTLNHDVCFEAAFEEAGLPYTVGFDPKGLWSQHSLDEMSSGIVLYKLHGSVNWVKDFGCYPFRKADRAEVLEQIKEPVARYTYAYLNDLTLAEYQTPVVHFGGRTKFVMEYPFLLFIHRLDYALKSAPVIVLAGYGMRDSHIGHLINQSFHYGRKTIIQVDPRPLSKENDAGEAAMFMARSRARSSEWEAIQTQMMLHQNMRYISLRRGAEEKGTWQELAEIVRAECRTA